MRRLFGSANPELQLLLDYDDKDIEMPVLEKKLSHNSFSKLPRDVLSLIGAFVKDKEFYQLRLINQQTHLLLQPAFAKILMENMLIKQYIEEHSCLDAPKVHLSKIFKFFIFVAEVCSIVFLIKKSIDLDKYILSARCFLSKWNDNLVDACSYFTYLLHTREVIEDCRDAWSEACADYFNKKIPLTNLTSCQVKWEWRDPASNLCSSFWELCDPIWGCEANRFWFLTLAIGAIGLEIMLLFVFSCFLFGHLSSLSLVDDRVSERYNTIHQFSYSTLSALFNIKKAHHHVEGNTISSEMVPISNII